MDLPKGSFTKNSTPTQSLKMNADIPATMAGTENQSCTLSEDAKTRFKQSIRVGCLEMERITEGIITTALEKIGDVVINNGLKAKITLFDSQSPTESSVYLCGASLRIENDDSVYALVFTGDPYSFEFSLQAHAVDETKIDQQVEYHKLTPNWIYHYALSFFEDHLTNIDITSLQPESDDWSSIQGPFTIKMKGKDDQYDVLATAQDLDEASRIGSLYCSTFHTQENVVLFDNQDRKVC